MTTRTLCSFYLENLIVVAIDASAPWAVSVSSVAVAVFNDTVVVLSSSVRECTASSADYAYPNGSTSIVAIVAIAISSEIIDQNVRVREPIGWVKETLLQVWLVSVELAIVKEVNLNEGRLPFQ